MNFERIKKLILGAAAAAAVTGVVIVAAVEYQAGWDFDPVGTDRALNVNQVVFPDGDKTTGQAEDSSDSSELWQKDDTASESGAPQQSDQADYLFEDSRAAESGAANGDTGSAQDETQGSPNGTQQGTIAGGEVRADAPQTVSVVSGGTDTANRGTADVVYDVTDDASNADLIISGDGTNGGAANGNGTSNGGTSVSPMPSASPAPSESPEPSAVPEPRPTAVPGGNTATPTPDSNTATPTPTAAPTPTTRPSEIADDPEIPDNNNGGGVIISVVYDEEKVSEIPEENRKLILQPSFDSSNAFYTGQKLTLKTVFGLLSLGVRDITNTTTQVAYNWSWEQYGTYVRINRISFDGGKTWIQGKDLPVTIPDNVGADDMRVEVSYRLKTTDKWQTEIIDNIPVSQSRVLVLDRVVSAGTTAIDSSWIVLSSSNTQYPTVGTKQCLYSYVDNYWKQALGGIPADKYLTQLFPGWTEKGKLLPWFYTVTAGRHVLEPAAAVPIDKNIYGVELNNYWITDDYVATLKGSGSYGQLQTLTYYAGANAKDADGAEYQERLAVPQYIQAVDMPYYPYVSVGYLDLPDSVIYVNTDGVMDVTDDAILYGRGLQVTKGYTVAAGNPRYTAQDGLLYNKEKTEIIGVPTSRDKLTVGANVTSVHLPYRSKLKSLTLSAKSLSALPTVNYAQMARGGTIYVHENLLDDFMVSQRTLLNRMHLYVAAIEDPDNNKYAIQDDLAVTDDGKVHKALAGATQQLKLPDYVTALEKGSLDRLNQLSFVLLPENGTVVDFEDGWADGAALTRIGCYTQEQYDAALAAAPDGVEVVMMPHSIEGYTYMETDDGVELISVSADVTYFNGMVPTYDGDELAVTVIGDGAFQNNTSLVWVDLPQETTTIGYQAFKGCTSLQGVLIGTTDDIIIEEEAFDQCSALRFVASNSMYGDVRDEDFKLVTASGNIMLYCPTDAPGYTANWTAFTPESGVTGYTLVDCGGTRALYGLNDNDEPWLMLRSGATVDGMMNLPATTMEIFVEAAQGARAADGGTFDVNWDELWNLSWIDGSVFSGSDIGAVITLPTDITLGDYVFEDCHKLTEITLPSEWGGITLDWGIFEGCENLTKVTFGQINYYSSLYAGMFNDCTGGADGHIDLYFEGYSAPKMIVYGENLPFYFNAIDWFDDAREAEHISVHVPEEYQETYLESWRYSLIGYDKDGGFWGESAYQSLWDKVYLDFYQQTGEIPADADVMAEADQRLTDSVNRARTLMGLPTVESSRKYELDVDPVMGVITLTAAHGITYTNLTASELEMPDAWTLDVIGSGAFKDSPELSSVFLPPTLVAIQDGAFDGVESLFGLTLQYMPGNCPQLTGFDEGTPFSFGVDDASIMLMDYFWGTDEADDFIQGWTLPMVGYYTYDSLYAAKKAELTAEDGTEPDEDAILAAVRAALKVGENRVRAMLQWEQLGEDDDITYRLPGEEAPDTGEDGSDGGEDGDDDLFPIFPDYFNMQTPETAQAADDTQAETEAAPTPAPTPAETEQPTAAPAETPQTTPAPTEAPQPVPEPTAVPTPTSPATPETAAGTEG